MNISSKLPNVGTTIFTVMSALANEHKAINLSQGFPNFDCDEALKKLVASYIKKGHNQYAPMPGVPALRKNLIQKISNQYGANLDPDTEITITAGATQAIFTAITALIRPDDEVILIEPAYDSYAPSVKVNGGIVRTYQLSAPDYKVDWKAFSRLITSRTKMIIINTPHNPTGSILEEEDLRKLETLTKGTDIIVLSDEVYEHIIFDKTDHQSVLKFPELYSRSLAVFSFGKTFHATGWKMGYVVGPDYLMREFRRVHQFNVFTVNTPIQYALADYIQKEENYIHLSEFYQKKRDFFANRIKDSRFDLLPCRGTYFQTVSYAKISDERDTDFAQRMTTEYGVAAIPVSVFYNNKKDEKVVRLCFAKTEDVLEKAAKLLCKI